ncbi:MAG: amidohydrolase family protein [Candidatus Dormibacteria bacterium]
MATALSNRNGRTAGVLWRSQDWLDLATVCNGPEEVRAAARRSVRRGATQLKLVVTGGVISSSDDLEDVQLSLDEIAAAVAEADNRGSYVTVHAHNSRGIQVSLRAGATCVEHGSYLDEETAVLIASKGAALVPTLSVTHLMRTEHRKWGVPGEVLPRLSGMEEAVGEAIRLARRHRILVGAGTDLLGPEQNRRGLELVLRARLEVPMSAIVAQTSANAAIMRRAADLGSVEVGRRADLIAVDGDPLANPALFDDPERVCLVIKAGKIAKDLRGLSGAAPKGEAA